MKADKSRKNYLTELVTPIRKRKQKIKEKENSSNVSNTCTKDNRKSIVKTLKEPSNATKLKKRNTITPTSIEILKIEVPKETANPFEDRIKKLEEIHQDHLGQVKAQFQDRIKYLEQELGEFREKVLQNGITQGVGAQDHKEASPLRKSVLDIFNSSRNGDQSAEEIHQEVIQQLEKQLHRMRSDCEEETQAIKDECQKELDEQREKYEQHLKSITECHQVEKTRLEERIQSLQENECSCAGDSYISSASKEMSMFHLTDQLALMANKYSDLKISTNQEILALKAKISTLKDVVASKNTEVAKISEKLKKSESKNRQTSEALAIKIKQLKNVKSKDIDTKVVQELQGQVNMLKRDMDRCELTEKKLKDAIKKKKHELIVERKLRKTESKIDIDIHLKKQEIMNKVEKDNRKTKAENTRLREENKKLKNRLSEFIFNKDISRCAYQTVNPTKNMDNSLLAPMSKYFSPIQDGKKYFYQRKMSHNSFWKADITFDERATSSRVIPNLHENLHDQSRMPPKSKYSTGTQNGSSFYFGDKKRCLSQNKTQRNQGGSKRYCGSSEDDLDEAKKISYDPLEIVNNRDLIKTIKCKACEGLYSPKSFIEHSKNCRLLNGVSPIKKKEIFCFKNSPCYCINCENSLTSSPKDLSAGSGRFSNERELVLNPDEDFEHINSNHEASNHNESEMISKIFPKNSTPDKSSSDNNSKLLTPGDKNGRVKKNKRVLQTIKPCKEKNTREISTRAAKKLHFDRESKRHINAKDLLNTINAFDQIEGVITENKKKMIEDPKKSCFYSTNATSKSKISLLYPSSLSKISSLKAFRKNKFGC
ncbi:unnamed protein product [Moneuplotes crassus]|uniref:Uncharacterized protein n=1 Tax=Euplotes crassus TaxID=5936 RepID=A0AAD1Y3R1_EUPCR|nr:unnamed protein product [Moneuplotes crassus]